MAYGSTRVWIKEGAIVDKFRKPITHAKGMIHKIFEKYKLDMYITSGREGNHMANSLHYVDLAMDIDLPPADLVDFIYMDIIDALNANGYDIILHTKSHYHVEWDPKRSDGILFKSGTY